MTMAQILDLIDAWNRSCVCHAVHGVPPESDLEEGRKRVVTEISLLVDAQYRVAAEREEASREVSSVERANYTNHIKNLAIKLGDALNALRLCIIAFNTEHPECIDLDECKACQRIDMAHCAALRCLEL